MIFIWGCVCLYMGLLYIKRLGIYKQAVTKNKETQNILDIILIVQNAEVKKQQKTSEITKVKRYYDYYFLRILYY